MAIADILMQRDKVTKEEADSIVNSTREEINSVIESGDFDLVEDLMYGDLGLEMDFIEELLF